MKRTKRARTFAIGLFERIVNHDGIGIKLDTVGTRGGMYEVGIEFANSSQIEDMICRLSEMREWHLAGERKILLHRKAWVEQTIATITQKLNQIQSSKQHHPR